MTLAAPTSLKIKIYRVTTTKPLVGWADASVLRAADMTVQSTQLLHLAEETSDLAQEGGLSKDGTDNIWDARYNKIKNLLDPTEPGDAVNLNYITKNQNSLLTQLRNTGAAQNASIIATGDAQNARLTATGDNQNTRLTTTGDTQNTRLVTTGNSYVSTMTTLRDATTTKATEANNSADLAKKWAVSSSSPDGTTDSKSSKTWAEAAKASANNAAASASASQSSADSSASYVATASSSANAAKQSALSSANSASAASSSASNASTSATNAKQSETNAANSAKAAKASADRAATFDPTTYAKYNEIFASTSTGRKSLEAEGITDLNDVKCLSYPSWMCNFTSTAASLSHCPTKGAFFLYNIRTEASSTEAILPNLTGRYYYAVQLLIDIGGQIWKREGFNSKKETFTFGSWTKLSSTSDLPTKTSQLTNDSGFAVISNGHLVINGSELWIE